MVITDRGSPSHVLLSIQEYLRLTGDRRSIVDWLSVDEQTDLASEPLNLRLTPPDL